MLSSNRWLVGTLLTVTFLGFIDATYLTVEHYLGGVVPCVLTSGCEAVTTSTYSRIGPVPVALVGALYYLAILLTVICLSLKQDSVKLNHYWRYLSYAFTLGLLTSLWFIYLQAFILQAWCFYCLVSATTSVLLFILGFYLRRQLHE